MDMSYDTASKVVGYTPGKHTWPFKFIKYLQNRDRNIVVICNQDLTKFNDYVYLKNFYGIYTLKTIEDISDLPEAMKDASTIDWNSLTYHKDEVKREDIIWLLTGNFKIIGMPKIKDTMHIEVITEPKPLVYIIAWK